MDRNDAIIGKIRKQRFLPLFYDAEASTCEKVARTLYEAGVRVIEFTNRGEQALTNFSKLVSLKRELPELLLAAGTIRSGAHAMDFINAGADFLISPVFEEEVADLAYLQKILWIPGCMTPTEIHRAQKTGCKLVKLFPGNILGPSFVSAIKELFPGMDFMPTGGVEIDRDNLKSWFDSGVCAVGLGSKLISKQFLEQKAFDSIGKQTRLAIQMLEKLSQNNYR